MNLIHKDLIFSNAEVWGYAYGLWVMHVQPTGTHKHTRTPTPSEEHKLQSQRLLKEVPYHTAGLYFSLKYFVNDGCRLQDAELFRFRHNYMKC